MLKAMESNNGLRINVFHFPLLVRPRESMGIEELHNKERDILEFIFLLLYRSPNIKFYNPRVPSVILLSFSDFYFYYDSSGCNSLSNNI